MWLEMYNKSVDSLFLCVCARVSERERKKIEHVHVVTSGQADKVRLYFQALFCTWDSIYCILCIYCSGFLVW